mmetsp:Transcript_85649/g.247270  ORF Transcript_85649/g.247270 Transcript_85649/m.247270 type:complete len:317 (-) Transcript_85649:2403-3353(-)
MVFWTSRNCASSCSEVPGLGDSAGPRAARVSSNASRRRAAARIIGIKSPPASDASRTRRAAAETVAFDRATGNSSASQGLFLAASSRQAHNLSIALCTSSLWASASTRSLAPKTATSRRVSASLSDLAFSTSFSRADQNWRSCSAYFSCLFLMLSLSLKVKIAGSSSCDMASFDAGGANPSDRSFLMHSSSPFVALDSNARNVCASKPWLLRFVVPATSCCLRSSCNFLIIARVCWKTITRGRFSESSDSRRSFSIWVVKVNSFKATVMACLSVRSFLRANSAACDSTALLDRRSCTWVVTCFVASVAFASAVEAS